MAGDLAGNIARLRRERGMTQHDLGLMLGVGFQAVSKWENGRTVPDALTLAELSEALGADPNAVLGYSAVESAPSKLCYEAMRLVPPADGRRVAVVGSPEGADAALFERNGYAVDAVAAGSLGGTPAVGGLGEGYDLVFSAAALGRVPKSCRAAAVADLQERTTEGRVHVLSVAVGRPAAALEWEPGELASLYDGWSIVAAREATAEENWSGMLRERRMDVLVARKAR